LGAFKEHRVGEDMRRWQLGRLSAVALAFLAAIAMGGLATESAGTCCDLAFRVGGGVYGFPISSADLKLEGAIGLPEFSLAAWMDLDVLLPITSTLGGELKLTQDWLSLSMIAQQDESQVDLTLKGQAKPTSWLLYDGVPTLIGGISAVAEATLLGDAQRSEITLSPFLTGVIPAGSITVTPAVGLDVSLDSETQRPTISGSRLVSTVNAGCVLIANTVHFTGLFEAFSSLVVSVNVPDCGLTVSGSLIPSILGGFSYRVSVSYEWGDSYLLPDQTGKPETVCTGDVCF